MGEQQVDWFPPSGGRFSAAVGFLVVAAVLGYGLVRPGLLPWPVVAAAPFGGVLVWIALVRPRVGLSRDELVLRGALQTVRLPLAAVHDLAVRRMLVVFAGTERYLNVAVSRSGLQLRRLDRAGGQARPESAADLAEARIRDHAAEARRRAGVADESAEQAALAAAVRRDWAWPEIAALVGTALLLGLTWGWSLAR